MMISTKPSDNFITKRRIEIATHLNTFLPNVISNLISNYDYYLKGESHISMRYDRAITCLAILSDGRIVSGSRSETINIWNPIGSLSSNSLHPQNEDCDTIFIGQHYIVSCIVALPNSSHRIVTGSFHGVLKIWNIQTKTCDMTLETGIVGEVSINIFPNDR